MLKLMRNTLGEGEILVDKDNNKVCQNYIVKLQEIQNDEGLTEVRE